MSDKMSQEEVRDARRWAYWTDADRSRIFAHIDALECELAAAEARGFERARGIAAEMVEESTGLLATAPRKRLAALIRAMKDETP